MPTVSFLVIFYYDDDTIEWNTPHLYNLFDGCYIYADEWNKHDYSESNKRRKIIEWKTLRHSESAKKTSNTHKKLMKSKWVLRSIVNDKDTLM